MKIFWLSSNFHLPDSLAPLLLCPLVVAAVNHLCTVSVFKLASVGLRGPQSQSGVQLWSRGDRLS